MKRARCAAEMSVLLFCIGCASTPPYGLPSTADLKKVRDGKQSIVMLRYAGTFNEKSFGLDPAHAKYRELSGVHWVNIETEERGLQTTRRSAWTTLASPSAEARRDGWYYLLLPPGDYRLWCVSMAAQGQAPFSVSLLLHISPGDGLVYIGTWHEICASLGTNQSYHSEQAQNCTPEIRDESEAARAVAQQSRLSQDATLVTRLLEQVPTHLQPGQLSNLSPVSLRVTARGVDDPQKLGYRRETGQLATDLQTGMLGPLPLLIWPFEEASRAAKASHDKTIFSKDIAPVVRRADPVATLRSNLQQALANTGVTVLDVAAGSEPSAGKSALDVTITHFRLEKGFAGTSGIFLPSVLWNYALDIDVHASVTESGTRRRLYDRICSFGDAHPRPLNNYRGEEGHAFLHQEILTGLNAIAAEIARDLTGEKK